MQRYNPLVSPDPEEWLALGEQERIDLARDYHRKARIRLPNAEVHATVHAIVETQIALGNETPARRTAQRLMDAGLPVASAEQCPQCGGAPRSINLGAKRQPCLTPAACRKAQYLG
jgi:hypothetical protein